MIGSGAQLFDRFNTITIRADSSADKLTVYSNSDCTGLTAQAKASNNIDKLDYRASVAVGSEDGERVRIEGKQIFIESVMSEIGISVSTYAKGSAIYAKDIKATNVMTADLNAYTTVAGTDLIGHDGARVTASTQPNYRYRNIDVVSRTQLNAAGNSYAISNPVITAKSILSITGDCTYTGSDLVAGTYALDDDRVSNELKTGGFIIQHEDDDSYELNIWEKSDITDLTLFLGDAAGGIFIDIYNAEDGTVAVREVGVRREEQIWSFEGDSITYSTSCPERQVCTERTLPETYTRTTATITIIRARSTE